MPRVLAVVLRVVNEVATGLFENLEENGNFPRRQDGQVDVVLCNGIAEKNMEFNYKFSQLLYRAHLVEQHCQLLKVLHVKGLTDQRNWHGVRCTVTDHDAVLLRRFCR